MAKFPRRSQAFYIILALVTLLVASLLSIEFLAKRESKPVEACSAKEGLVVCLHSPLSKVGSSEDITLKTTLKNNSDKDITQTFSCTHTDPSIVLNGANMDRGTICGAAITDKVIEAHSSESFDYTLPASKLRQGHNDLKAVWGKFESGTINLSRGEVSENELANQFNTCQSLADNIEYSDVPGFCASIDIILKDSNNGQYDCAAWKAVIKQAGLSIPCDSVMDIGVSYVYVPRSDAQRWLNKIKALPEVESAYIDKQS